MIVKDKNLIQIIISSISSACLLVVVDSEIQVLECWGTISFRGPDHEPCIFFWASEEEEGHHRCPAPPYLDDASATAVADGDIGGDRRQRFCGLTFDVESARCQSRLLELKPRQRWRRRGSYNDDGDAGTRNGNNIEDGSGDVGVWY